MSFRKSIFLKARLARLSRIMELRFYANFQIFINVCKVKKEHHPSKFKDTASSLVRLF